MQPIPTTALDPPSPWLVPAPVLLNIWKHHAAALRHRICATIDAGPPALPGLAADLVVIGSKLMDLYTGTYTPSEIARLIVERLNTENRLNLSNFRSWVDSQGGYGMLELPDASQWVLRAADEQERYVHLHPGRWVPQTRRVRANVLKTAVMTLAHVGIHGGKPLDRALVNHVRASYLGLSPIGRDLDGEQGLGEVIELLC